MQGRQSDDRLEATYEYEYEAPFYIEPIVAWRAWSVCAPGVCTCARCRGRTLIRSISRNLPWLRRKATRAHCLDQWRRNYIKSVATSSFNHCAPSHSHGCGLYAVKRLGQAMRWAHYYRGKFCIIGQVQIWGQVLQYKHGYIAEYAYPLELYVPDNYDFYLSDEGVQEKGHPEISPEEIGSMLEDAYAIPVHIGWPE